MAQAMSFSISSFFSPRENGRTLALFKVRTSDTHLRFKPAQNTVIADVKLEEGTVVAKLHLKEVECGGKTAVVVGYGLRVGWVNKDHLEDRSCTTLPDSTFGEEKWVTVNSTSMGDTVNIEDISSQHFFDPGGCPYEITSS